MSTALMTEPQSPANGDGPMIVRPAATLGMAAEQARVQAEIQSALTVAAARPRHEVSAIDSIAISCQRPGLAEKAEYVYSRGGSEISGPTIDLLTVIANHWGNVSYGFRELSENPQESVVEAFAWDLQTNAKRAVTFTVKHVRHTRTSITPLTDPRDRYENLANLSQRRVRACLEAIIPPDVVEDAVAQCRATLKETAQVTPDSIGKLMEAFGKMGVTKDQLEKRLGRRLDAMQPAQLVNLRRIYKSITDGMSKPADWFEQSEGEQPQTAADAAKDALRKKAAPAPESQPDAGDRPQTGDEPSSDLSAEADNTFLDANSISDVEAIRVSLAKKATTDADRTMLLGKAEARANEIRASRGDRSNKK